MKSVAAFHHCPGVRRTSWALLIVLALASGPLCAQGRVQLLDAEGSPAPGLASSTNAALVVDFGTVRVGFIRQLGLQYSNVGGGPITNIVVGPLEGDDPDMFSIHQDECTGATLNPGEACLIVVRFEPDDMADYSAEFVVTSTADNSPELVVLLGSGIFDEIFHDRFQ